MLDWLKPPFLKVVEWRWQRWEARLVRMIERTVQDNESELFVHPNDESPAKWVVMSTSRYMTLQSFVVYADTARAFAGALPPIDPLSATHGHIEGRLYTDDLRGDRDR